MLQNAYFVAKIGADTAENERNFAEILPTDALCRLLPGDVEADRQVGLGGVRLGLLLGGPTRRYNAADTWHTYVFSKL